MRDDYWSDYDGPYEPDQDTWDVERNKRVQIVFNLIDLLIKLKVLGVGWDMDHSVDHNTGTYVDRHWKH